jgi:hypothetical protein
VPENKTLKGSKQAAFERVLQPAGFTRGSHLYLRRADGQLHGVQFQTSRFAAKYYVNLAFHYDFLPPQLATLTATKPPPPEKWELVDFLFNIRLEDLMPPRYPADWRYDRGADAVGKQMEKNARDAVGALEKIGRKWREPEVMLKLLPPDLLEEDHSQSISRADVHPADMASLPPLPFEAAVGEGWSVPRYSYLGYCLALIARRAGRDKLAPKYLDFAQSHAQGREAKALAALRRQPEPPTKTKR